MIRTESVWILDLASGQEEEIIMRLFKFCSLVVLALLISGCAANVKYSMDKDIYKRDVPINRVAIVDVIEDVRPTEECEGIYYNSGDLTYSSDKQFKPNINRQASQMLVDHLNKARIFKVVELRDVDNDLEKNAAEMNLLHNQGIDLVIIGNLRHFYGYQSGVTSAAMAAGLFGLAGALTEAAINPKTVGGNVEYCDIKIIDLGNKGILWKGNINYEFKKKVTFPEATVSYSLLALKEGNNKFIKKLEEICEERKIIKDPRVGVADSRPKIFSYSEYYRTIHKTIYNAVVRPSGSRSGTINATFILRSDGSLEDANILEGSSEDVLLRKAVIDAIKNSSPFPAFSEDIKEEKKSFTITIDFRYSK